jgi:hypothetical protein
VKTFCTCVLLAGASVVGWSALSLAEEPVSFALSTKELGFPAIDTTITFTRLSEHTYRVQYTTPPPTPNDLMLYTGFFFCAARQFAVDTGDDRVPRCRIFAARIVRRSCRPIKST